MENQSLKSLLVQGLVTGAGVVAIEVVAKGLAFGYTTAQNWRRNRKAKAVPQQVQQSA